ncbi:hypothetical protein [Phaffia rhodozyma]|uniref:Uncharacterized protein n=1 Tax=Phaffia rhodozyma TaxID=264483 RepID=A0A0F7SKS7_PHARH|nr:hypothetical protein [Phaffia rhodozyma]
MAKANPDYDLFAYMSGRDTAAKSDPIFHIDPLNRGGPQIGRRMFKKLGHYQSHIVHSPEMVETDARGSFFYGPYTTLHSHAAGGQDWFTLPRINESSESQSDPVVVPWHITFDLLSNAKLGIIDVLDLFDGLVEGDQPVDDHHSTKAAFLEAETLEYADFKNSLVGNNPTSSQRSILRRVFFFIGGLISEPVAWILQLHYLYTRSTSTGIGLPSVILGSSAHLAFYSILIALASLDAESGLIFAIILFVIPALIPFVLQVNLWLGLEFAWLSWNGIPVPVGFKRFKPSHAERMSRRIDQQFTWIQRGLIVVLLTVIYIYSPHVISSPLHSSSSSPRLSLSSLYSTGSSWSKLFGVVSHRYGWSLLTSITLMSSLSQMLLNMRLGTFGGMYKVHVWTQIIGFIFLWTPVVFKFIFGKFETTAPLDLSEFMVFAFNLVLFWQANTLPNVKQDEEPDE